MHPLPTTACKPATLTTAIPGGHLSIHLSTYLSHLVVEQGAALLTIYTYYGYTYYGYTYYCSNLVVEQGEARGRLIALPCPARGGEAGKGGEGSRGHLERRRRVV